MNPNLTLLTALLLASLAALHAADAPKLLPPGWDPTLAGDVVMQRLVKVTAPQVKGAHDAEFVCVGRSRLHRGARQRCGAGTRRGRGACTAC